MSAQTSMTEGPILKKLILYTLPIIATSVLQLLFNAADLAIVGSYRGSLYMGAVGATSSITNLIINLFMGLSIGAGVSVARSIGERSDKEVSHTVHTAIPVAVICGIVLTAIGVLFAGTFLKWMSTPDTTLPLATTYMRIYFCGMTFSLIYNYGASILRAAGDTKGPLIMLTISGILNVIFNVVFVAGFGMNVDGVAYATVISQAFSAFMVLYLLMKRTDSCHLELKKLRIHKKSLSEILRIGLPAGFQNSLFAISNVLIQSSINSFGEIVLNGSSAAANLEGFAYVVMNGFQQTALNYCGQNSGAGYYDRVAKIIKYCVVCVFIAGLLASLLLNILSAPLLRIYINDSEEAIACGQTRLLWVNSLYFLCGVLEVVVGCTRGMGASLSPMIITVFGACIMRIVWIFTIFQIERFHTIECLFASYPISWLLTLIMQSVLLARVFRKQKKEYEERSNSEFGMRNAELHENA